jgi:hypothetical protein
MRNREPRDPKIILKEIVQDMKEWTLSGWINYGIRLGFFVDENDALNGIEAKRKEFEEFEMFEELAWLKNEIEKYGTK